MPFRSSPSPKFICLDPGGQHVRCSPRDLEGLILDVPDLSEIKVVYDVYKPTSAMPEFASHLSRLSRAPEGGLCYNHACCDLSDAWNRIGGAGKAQVYSGVSTKGGTLVLLFAPIQHHGEYIVEVDCRY
jgi:hypothetical protein